MKNIVSYLMMYLFCVPEHFMKAFRNPLVQSNGYKYLHGLLKKITYKSLYAQHNQKVALWNYLITVSRNRTP